MTEEQAREAARDKYIGDNYRNDYEETVQRHTFDAAWDAAMEHANRWTYLPELPKQSGFYIVTVTDELNCDGETVEQMWFHDSLDDWEINQDVRRVIAWRPLPEPAKA